LVDGKPTAGVELVADYRSGSGKTAATTDAKDRAKIKICNAQLNVIAASFNKKVGDNPAIDEIMMHSTLSFISSQSIKNPTHNKN